MLNLKKSAIVLAMMLIAVAGAAHAEYPDKPVEFVVPWPPGDLEDVLTRMIADKFQETYGSPAAVVNRPGGGGGPFPGAVEVATSPSDGYTVGSFVTGVPIGGPQIGIPELSPNPFEPIGIFVTYPFVIAAGQDAPYDDWTGMVEHAGSNDLVLGHFGDFLYPTKVTFAAAQESGFAFSANAAFDALDCNTLASGDVDVINTTLQQILPCKDEVKILASIGGERIGITPNVPTVKELHPTLSLALWNGLFVNKDVPRDARDKIAAVAREVMASPEAAKLAEDTGALIYWKNAEESAAQIKADTAVIEAIEAMLAN